MYNLHGGYVRYWKFFRKNQTASLGIFPARNEEEAWEFFKEVYFISNQENYFVVECSEDEVDF
jgi:hypothetical protein